MANSLTFPSIETDADLAGYQTSSATITRIAPAGGLVAPDGSSVLQAVYTSGTNMLVNTDPQTVTAAPGDVWSVGVFARFTTGTARGFHVDIQWLDSTNAVISTVQPSNVTLTGSFVQFKNEGAVAPALTTHLRIRTTYITAVAGETIELDAFQIEKAATLPAYNPVTVLPAPLLTESGIPLLLESGLPLRA
jgi:hypothetical protein